MKICTKCHVELAEDISECPYDGAVLEALPGDALIGKTFADRYEILSVLGKGGMSVVYKARHKLMGRIVAIKLLHPHLVSNEAAVKRFQQEAQAASSLNHPNVIGVHDFGIINKNQAYLVMDCLEGMTLSEVLENEEHISVERAARIFRQVCAGLEHAHEKGIIHRDLKPSNLCLIREDNGNELVKIVDFGIAKLLPQDGQQQQQLTQTGEVFGSPLFMSPEQCQAKPLDTRADIYSLGCVMYEALCGMPPLMGDTCYDTMTMHIKTQPQTFKQVAPNLNIPQDIEAIVLRCLEKRPEDRYQSAAQVLADLPSCGPLTGSIKIKPVEHPRKSRTSLIVFKSLSALLTLPLLVFLYAAFTPGPENDRGTPLQKMIWNFELGLSQQLINDGQLQLARSVLDQASKVAGTLGDRQHRLAATLNIQEQLFRRLDMFEEEEKASRKIIELKDSWLIDDFEAALSNLDGMARGSMHGIAHSLTKIDAGIEADNLAHLSEELFSRLNDKNAVLLRRAIEVYTQVLGPEDPCVARFQILLADDCVYEQKPEEAHRLLIQAQRTYAATSGRNARGTILATLKLGQLDRDQSRFTAARRELHEALARTQAFYSADVDLLCQCFWSLADYYQQIGDNKAAEQYLARAKALPTKLK